MRRRDEHGPGTPEDWLLRAKSNLARLSSPKPAGVLWEDVCYDSQQAAEKALKAMLCYKKIGFRPVHDIGELIDALVKGGVPVPNDVREASVLTVYAVQTRYPGDYERVTEEEFLDALKMAGKVVSWAEKNVNG